MTQKVEFAGDEWLEAIASKLARFAAANPNVTLSICEVFTDAPARLGGRIAWHARIAGGRSAFARTEIDDADIKNIADYDTILPFARLHLSEETKPVYEQMMAEALASGKLRRVGTVDAPAALHALHNEMAEITL